MADIFKAQKRPRSAISDTNPDLFLQMLLVVDQEKNNSTIPPLDREEPKFYWIFKNIDFELWEQSTTPSSQVLWLSGPPECNVHQASSDMVDLMKKCPELQHFVLYFFCLSASRKKSIASVFIHTLLYQTICCLPPDKKVSIIRKLSLYSSRSNC
jgi:ankyrin repeat domain-containing protein 50